MMVQALALSRRPHIVVATPGRLADHLQSTDTVFMEKIKYLVLDEADRLLEKCFEDDLSVIFERLPEKRQTLLFSATLTDSLNRLKELSTTPPFCWEAPKEAALRVQILLSMNRLDLAKKELKIMQEKDDDATLSQLALAWFNLAVGGDKYQDAYYIYQELADKTTPTPLLLNGQAVCMISQGKYDEAESALQDALSKDSNNPETLVNLVVVSHHLGKPSAVSQRYMAQLKDGHGGHLYVQQFKSKEEEFDRLSSQYSGNN
uniref:Coatomer subunit epsilon n=1 Tax=Amphimedon queenslandica TaxID=400682 RepID=A0A1X7UVJ0_AMPQE